MRHLKTTLAALALLPVAGCLSSDPSTLGLTPPGSGPTVKFDVFHTPFPEIPLPNDFATRFDETSPTRRRLNASIITGTTKWERATRAELDKLSGWGTLSPITVGFDAPIDPEVIFARHRNDRLDFSDDAVLVVNVTPGSPGLCEAVPLDLGQGNWPGMLHDTAIYDADPRANLNTVSFEETEEDVNGNGVLDPGEDTDMDGVLDHPNTRDGKVGSELLEFYERETNTLIMKPIMPMREATTYAVVLTRRLTGTDGAPVRSPWEGINHTSQTMALAPLGGCLGRYGLATADVAFTWSFTTQSISDDYVKVRDGLHGLGPMATLSTDFPGAISVLNDLRDAAPGINTKIVPMDVFLPLALQLVQLTGASADQAKIFEVTMKNVDFVVAGEVQSPQFFPRWDSAGALLPLYDQVWNLGAAPRAEAVPFWLFVPKNRKGPAPVTLFIHGHSGSKFDAIQFAGVMASYGVATLGFDAPSHGISLDKSQTDLLVALFKQEGLGGLADRLLNARAIDWDMDGSVDPGADYWTAYIFHTRDIVRQTMVDAMQLVRMLRGFDGKATWQWDPAGKGAPGLAGDFDGDGTIDVGGTAPLHVVGGSLGGITGSVIAGVEPEVESVVAIIPGGNLSEVGPRSTLGLVKSAMMLRTLGPIFYADQGQLMLRANLHETEPQTVAIADLPALTPKDTVTLTNLTTGEYRCGVVQPSGTFRATVPSDKGDPLVLRIYAGVLPPKQPEGCTVPSGTAPALEIATFGKPVKFGPDMYSPGDPLMAVTDGFGQRRGTPELRRFLGLAQVGLESADPMNWAPYWDGTRTLTYGTGETTRTNVIVMPSVGDPGVLVATGIALGRAAGYIDYTHDDPRYGKPQNQVLLDHHAMEGVPRVSPYKNSKGEQVLMDLENFASIVPVDDGFDVPRLDPPLRLMKQREDGSWAGFMFPMFKPTGEHGFDAPDPSQPFDLGTYLMNITGRYIASGGTQFSYDKCQVDSTCPWPTLPLK